MSNPQQPVTQQPEQQHVPQQPDPHQQLYQTRAQMQQIGQVHQQMQHQLQQQQAQYNQFALSELQHAQVFAQQMMSAGNQQQIAPQVPHQLIQQPLLYPYLPQGYMSYSGGGLFFSYSNPTSDEKLFENQTSSSYSGGGIGIQSSSTQGSSFSAGISVVDMEQENKTKNLSNRNADPRVLYFPLDNLPPDLSFALIADGIKGHFEQTKESREQMKSIFK